MKNRKCTAPEYFGIAHRSIRKFLNITQQQEVELTGGILSDSQISAYECFKYLPRNQYMVDVLMAAMGCNGAQRRRLREAYAKSIAARKGIDGE